MIAEKYVEIGSPVLGGDIHLSRVEGLSVKERCVHLCESLDSILPFLKNAWIYLDPNIFKLVEVMGDGGLGACIIPDDGTAQRLACRAVPCYGGLPLIGNAWYSPGEYQKG